MNTKKLVNICAVLLLILGMAACTAATNTKPISQTSTFDIQGQKVTGIRLLQSNGVSFAGAYRAEKGVVVCGHFDVSALEKAGIPAAMAKNWKKNGLQGELNAPIEKVNHLAAAKGVKIGMQVREALSLLNR